MTSFQNSARFLRSEHLPGIEAVSVAYSDREFPCHSHREYVVGTVTSGAETLTVNRREHFVGPGDVLLLHPDEAHANRSIGHEMLRYIVFYLPLETMQPYLDTEGDMVPPCFSSPAFKNAHLARTLIEAHHVLSLAHADKLEHESAFLWIIDALRYCQARKLRNYKDGGAAVREARLWIDEHLRENFGLTEIAAAVGLSRFRLAHLFKETVGLSPMAYRNQRRIQESRYMLLNGQPIAEIAGEVGYADQSHFTRQFQRIIGTSPLRYLQQ